MSESQNPAQSSCCSSSAVQKHQPDNAVSDCGSNQASSSCKTASGAVEVAGGSMNQSVDGLAHADHVRQGCCSTSAPTESQHSEESGCCAPPEKGKIDWILWGSGLFVAIAYTAHLFFGTQLTDTWSILADTSFEMMNAMWWGIIMGALAVGALGRIPSEMVMSVLGKGGTKRGVVRATMAGLLLDLCNHGILMIAMGLYRKGASLGQVMAFLIASPWNSFTLTLILIGLIGLPWTLAFIAFSMVIAWISGVLFDRLEGTVLPANPNAVPHNAEFKLWPELKSHMKGADWSLKNLLNIAWSGLKESKMVLRWVFFGVVLVALVRAFVDVDQFGIWFGATVSGLFLTLLVTTVMEVCSEGSSPIAADLVTRANAPGNGFVFLMAGAATDYTEIMSLKDTTKSWKIALFLPLVTVPQVLVIGYLMNGFA